MAGNREAADQPAPAGERQPQASAALPEPWLRGTITDLNPVAAQVLYTFQHVQEDLSRWTSGISDSAVWRWPAPRIPPLGFHLKHIPGAADRLLTYAEGAELNAAQLAAARRELEPEFTLAELMRRLSRSLADAEARVRRLATIPLDQARSVGRLHLPTTLGGLLVHIAEHSQRHLGQAIVTAKLVSSGAIV